jgi:hypothetical protein
MNPLKFELFLFTTDPQTIQGAVNAGVDGIIVDWESAGKINRQAGYDTQINQSTIEDLEKVRKATDAHVICRVNGYSDHTSVEIEKAIQAEANEILLPMVRTAGEVERTLEIINGRCKLGILVETIAAAGIASKLNEFPLSRVYAGLNDLAIDRKLENIFISVEDGTVEQIRKDFSVPFGFGGLTLPEKGDPIPCRYLMGEMARLNCDFTFLRRSFLRDIKGRDMMIEVPRIRKTLMDMNQRTRAQVEEDRRMLNEFIKKIPSRMVARMQK